MSSWDQPASDPLTDIERMLDAMKGDLLSNGHAFAVYNDLYVEVTADDSSIRCGACGHKKMLATFPGGFFLLCPNACTRPEVVGG